MCSLGVNDGVNADSVAIPSYLELVASRVSLDQYVTYATLHFSLKRTHSSHSDAHRGGVEDWMICSFGTEAPSVAGAEGPDGGFRVSRWWQMAEGQRAHRGSWTPAGVGTGGGDYLAGGATRRRRGPRRRTGAGGSAES